jgi:hypothetical protein
MYVPPFRCYTAAWQTRSRGIEYTNSVALVRERTVPTERPPLVGEVTADRECLVVSATDPYDRILDFLDRWNTLSNIIIGYMLYAICDALKEPRSMCKPYHCSATVQ